MYVFSERTCLPWLIFTSIKAGFEVPSGEQLTIMIIVIIITDYQQQLLPVLV